MGAIKVINIKEVIIEGFNPICNSQYWFASVYVLMSLMKPGINKLIRKIEHKYYIPILLIFLAYYILNWINIAVYLGLVRGLFYYYLGAIIRFKQEKLAKYKTQFLIIGIFSWLCYAAMGYQRFIPLSDIISICFLGSLSACGITIFAICTEITANRFLNRIASSTFAVYLIHEHPLLRKFLWSNLFHVETIQYTSSMFILYSLGTIVLVFVVSIGLDFARMYIFDRLNTIRVRFQNEHLN